MSQYLGFLHVRQPKRFAPPSSCLLPCLDPITTRTTRHAWTVASSYAVHAYRSASRLCHIAGQQFWQANLSASPGWRRTTAAAQQRAATELSHSPLHQPVNPLQLTLLPLLVACVQMARLPLHFTRKLDTSQSTTTSNKATMQTAAPTVVTVVMNSMRSLLSETPRLRELVQVDLAQFTMNPLATRHPL